MAVERAAQRIGRHRAQVALGGADDVGKVAVLLFQLLERGARAPVAVFADHGEALAGDVAGLEHGSSIHAAHKTAHVVVGGVAQNIVGRAHLHHLAVFHDGNAVTNAHGLVQVVRDEHDGAALDLLQAHQLALHLGADDGVECRERLVHQQNRRVGGQRPRQPHALLHATREFIGVAGAPASQAHLLQRQCGLALALGALHARQLQAKGGVVQHRHVRHQRKRLEHHADVLAPQRPHVGVRELVDVHIVHQNAPGGGLDQAVEHAHQRRFARARQAHDDKNLARANGEAGIEHANRVPRARQDVVFAVALAQQRQRGVGRIAENLEHMFDGDLFGHAGSSPQRWVQCRPGQRPERHVRPWVQMHTEQK